MAGPADIIELDWVRDELDRLVSLRFSGPFAPKDKARYAALIQRERELLDEAARELAQLVR